MLKTFYWSWLNIIFPISISVLMNSLHTFFSSNIYQVKYYVQYCLFRNMNSDFVVKIHTWVVIFLELNWLGDDAIGQLGVGMKNVAFLTWFLSGDLNACLEIPLSTKRTPEAALFTRTIDAKAGQSLPESGQEKKNKTAFHLFIYYIFFKFICLLSK